MNPVPVPESGRGKSVLEGVTFYHWLIVIIASCGWLFDCMDQRIFILARESALKELLAGDPVAFDKVKSYIGWATTVMILGWATGGIIFGMMSDRLGRVKTMVATLLIYSGFTGLSGFAQGWTDFIVYRFLVGLGVGGMFGAATTLVAESVPGNFRSIALGSLQALSAMGNILGSLISLKIQPGDPNFLGQFAGWRVLFFVGILPSLLIVPIVLFLREPASWLQAKKEAASGASHKNVGSIAELFRHPRWRRHTITGLLLGVSGMIGLWGIGFFSPELISTALKNTPLRGQDLVEPGKLMEALKAPATPASIYVAEALSPEARARLQAINTSLPISKTDQELLAAELQRIVERPDFYRPTVFESAKLDASTLSLANKLQTLKNPDVLLLNRQVLEQTFPGTIAKLQKFIDTMRGRGTALQDVGAFLGMITFTFVASFMSRRIAFLGAFILCLGITMFVFNSLKTATDAYWMLPMMGFAQLAVFAGYSIYFPELFPTRLRGTGVGFCYNTVRYLAAPWPSLMGYLSTLLSFRTAAILMSFIYVVGMVALIWAPETKGQPLPED